MSEQARPYTRHWAIDFRLCWYRCSEQQQEEEESGDKNKAVDAVSEPKDFDLAHGLTGCVSLHRSMSSSYHMPVLVPQLILGGWTGSWSASAECSVGT